MTYAEAKRIMKDNGWYTTRCPYRGWKWILCAKFYDCFVRHETNGFETQAEAVSWGVERNFEHGDPHNCRG